MIYIFTKKNYIFSLGNIDVNTFLFSIKERHNVMVQLVKTREMKEATNLPYVKLLDQFPVYRDSSYCIYLAIINNGSKIILIKKDSISKKQRKSKFFVHIYPHDKALLDENDFGNLNYDFNNNVTSFIFKEKCYFVSSTNLPNIRINKINSGQYGFNGNSNINWSINSFLEELLIKRTLEVNKEKMLQFQ